MLANKWLKRHDLQSALLLKTAYGITVLVPLLAGYASCFISVELSNDHPICDTETGTCFTSNE